MYHLLQTFSIANGCGDSFRCGTATSARSLGRPPLLIWRSGWGRRGRERFPVRRFGTSSRLLRRSHFFTLTSQGNWCVCGLHRLCFYLDFTLDILFFIWKNWAMCRFNLVDYTPDMPSENSLTVHISLHTQIRQAALAASRGRVFCLFSRWDSHTRFLPLMKHIDVITSCLTGWIRTHLSAVATKKSHNTLFCLLELCSSNTRERTRSSEQACVCVCVWESEFLTI